MPYIFDGLNVDQEAYDSSQARHEVTMAAYRIDAPDSPFDFIKMDIQGATP